MNGDRCPLHRAPLLALRAPSKSRMMLCDLPKAEADFVGRFGADGASDFDAVFEEDRGGPEFYSEGSAEWATGAVFDFDVFDGWKPGERFANERRGALAVAAPAGAEF